MASRQKPGYLSAYCARSPYYLQSVRYFIHVIFFRNFLGIERDAAAEASCLQDLLRFIPRSCSQAEPSNQGGSGTAETALELFTRCASKGLSSHREAMSMKTIAVCQACQLHLDDSTLEKRHFSQALYAPALRHSSAISTAPLKR